MDLNKMKRTAAVILMTAVAGIAGAEDSEWYAGVGLGASGFDGVADADGNMLAFPAGGPFLVSIDGLPFDGTETAWSVFGGYNIRDWLSVEVGFWDLGNNAAEFTRTALEVEEFYVSTRFQYPLTPKLTANWTLGITSADFEAEGRPFGFIATNFMPPPGGFTLPPGAISLPPGVTPGTIIGGGLPLIFPPPDIRVSSPGSETGFIWGLGFEWSINDRFGFDVSYRKHETQVLGIDTYAGALIVRF